MISLSCSQTGTRSHLFEIDQMTATLPSHLIGQNALTDGTNCLLISSLKLPWKCKFSITKRHGTKNSNPSSLLHIYPTWRKFTSRRETLLSLRGQGRVSHSLLLLSAVRRSGDVHGLTRLLSHCVLSERAQMLAYPSGWLIRVDLIHDSWLCYCFPFKQALEGVRLESIFLKVGRG